MCLILVAGMTVGCYEDSSDKLKEQLVGAWDMSGNGETYAYFYPDGELAFYDIEKDRLVLWSYTVDGDKVIATGKSIDVAGDRTELTSVEINEQMISFYQGNNDHRTTWYACDEELTEMVYSMIELRR